MFSRMIAGMLPYFPKGLVRKVAGRYIAGDSSEDAIKLAMALESRGFVATLDMLGEDTVDLEDAGKAVASYKALMDQMAARGIERNISIKLSQLGLRLSSQAAFDNLMRVVDQASRLDFFVRIDMEDSSVTDATLSFYTRALEQWPRMGTVLQSRLKRTASDARALANERGNFRLCKGIYPENPEIAFADPDDIRNSYLGILETLIEGGSYVALATHDLPMLDRVRTLLKEMGTDESRYEFQALLGVPIGTTLEGLREAGHKVRLYIPFGDDWYAYSLRRLHENPQMAGAITKSLFNKDQLDLKREVA